MGGFSRSSNLLMRCRTFGAPPEKSVGRSRDLKAAQRFGRALEGSVTRCKVLWHAARFYEPPADSVRRPKVLRRRKAPGRVRELGERLEGAVSRREALRGAAGRCDGSPGLQATGKLYEASERSRRHFEALWAARELRVSRPTGCRRCSLHCPPPGRGGGRRNLSAYRCSGTAGRSCHT